MASLLHLRSLVLTMVLGLGLASVAQADSKALVAAAADLKFGACRKVCQ
jgi:hypothetical protein